MTKLGAGSTTGLVPAPALVQVYMPAGGYVAVSEWICSSAICNLRRFVFASPTIRACWREPSKLGMAIAPRMPMRARTVSSSIREKPLVRSERGDRRDMGASLGRKLIARIMRSVLAHDIGNAENRHVH